MNKLAHPVWMIIGCCLGIIIGGLAVMSVYMSVYRRGFDNGYQWGAKGLQNPFEQSESERPPSMW